MLCRTRLSTRWLTAPAAAVALCWCGVAAAQEKDHGDGDVTEHASDGANAGQAVEPRARFVLTNKTSAEANTHQVIGESGESVTVLEAGPAGLNKGEAGDPNEAQATASLEAEQWLLETQPLAVTDPAEGGQLTWSGAEVVQQAALPRSGTNAAGVRTNVAYGVEASQLTLLSGGKQVFTFEVADGLTLAGVGSSRLWTERDRAFVLAAEAGWQLSPRAGLHLGYEVFQTPTSGALPPSAGGDSIFARFQLRF